MYSNSKADLLVFDYTTILSKITLYVVQALTTLAENRQVLLKWIPVQRGFKGNDEADTLAKKDDNNTEATWLDLPIPGGLPRTRHLQLGQ